MQTHKHQKVRGFVFIVNDVNALSPWAILKVLQYWDSMF